MGSQVDVRAKWILPEDILHEGRYPAGMEALEAYPSATTRPRVAVPGETNLSTQVTTDTAVA